MFPTTMRIKYDKICLRSHINHVYWNYYSIHWLTKKKEKTNKQQKTSLKPVMSSHFKLIGFSAFQNMISSS